MFKVLLTALISFSLILCDNVATAQEKAESINTVEKLNSRILKLQQQILEMRKKHDAEMDALKKEVEELAAVISRQKKEEDIAALRQAAKMEVTETIATEGKPEEVVFESGALGLQALNPEISVTGDFLFSHRQDSTSDESSDFDFRTLGLHIESWLDPYTRLKAAIPVTEDDTALTDILYIRHGKEHSYLLLHPACRHVLKLLSYHGIKILFKPGWRNPYRVLHGYYLVHRKTHPPFYILI